MAEKILIVEDQFVEADYLRMMLTKAGYHVTGIAHSVALAKELLQQERPDIVLLDIFVKGKRTGIDLAAELAEENIAFIYLSASSNEEVLNAAKATQPYGFLVKPFREKDLLIMLEIARYRHSHSVDARQRKESILQDKLAAAIHGSGSREQKIFNICRTLQPYVTFDYITAGFNTILEDPGNAISFLRTGFDEYQKIGVPELLTIGNIKSKELESIVLNGGLYEMLSDTFNMKSCASFRLYNSDGQLFTISVYSKQPDSYNSDRSDLLNILQRSIGGFLDSFPATDKKNPPVTTTLPARIANPESASHFEGIVGKSPLLLTIFDHITQVAPSDTSVLILGESGTGKERIADVVHKLSPRKDKPLVKVNCAALPATLIESELFGHEKGAFTGALDRRIGKFEKADGGSIFLDEIGEMPLDLQVKLLRVLQEKYIERVGARDITRVDVRIIAATNRNLEKEVAEGRFRLDLYYRLNVFPIELPPLRERREDIPALASHFITQYNRKAGKRITAISDKAIKNMETYDWPGNIRELENIIERSVLLAKGTTIEDVSLPNNERKFAGAAPFEGPAKTIHENERDYIISVLKKCNGRIWGAGGAAEILNLPPTTLRSKMIKLGIDKENFH